MPLSPGDSSPRRRRRTVQVDVDHWPRDGREWSIPLNIKNPTPGIDEPLYVPAFPMVFNETELTYGHAYEVFFTHYLQAGLYGGKGKALMRIEHYGLYQMLWFHADHGERFYASDLAANLEVGKNTIIEYLDRLENLQLIERFRNTKSMNRWVSIIVKTPQAAPRLHRGKGRELMDRIRNKAVQEERKAAGPGRWPFLEWDAETMSRALRGQPVTKDLKIMQDAIGVIRGRFEVAGVGYSPAELETQVRGLCRSWDAKFTDKLFLTAMCERHLRRAPEKEAPL